MEEKKILNPLKVFVIWDKSFKDGQKYADNIYTLISRPAMEPTLSGIGIPVDFIDNNSGLIDCSVNEQNLIFILVDNYLIADRDRWNNALKNLTGRNNVLIIPIPFDIGDFGAIECLRKIQYATIKDNNKTEEFEFTICFGVSRILNRLNQEDDDVKLFLSYHRKTGEKIAKKIKKEIDSSTKFTTFFDRNQIPDGERFDLKIIENIKDSIVIAFLTDGYSSREWCVRELIIAKQNGRPIILLDFYNEGERRLFPYLGNVRMIRVNGKKIRYYKLFVSILLENIRLRYHEIHTKYLIKLFEIKNQNYTIMKQPPELLTVLNHNENQNAYIYPEPPISNDEKEIVNAVNVNKGNIYLTPIMFSILGTNLDFSMPKREIGISISYPQTATQNDIYKIEDIIAMVMKYFLALDYNVYYAGNPKHKKDRSFSIILSSIEEKQNEFGEQKAKKLTLLIQEDIYKKMEIKEINRYRTHTNIKKVKEKTGEHKLTTLRKSMVNHVDTNIIVGGKTENYEGNLPGVLEEFLLAIEKGNAIFLLGGFGGATKGICDILLGKEKEVLKEFEQAKKYTIDNLNNGLSKKDNETLMTTKNNNIATALILKGIKKLS